ncbi:MAG: TolC family protein, partial [Magnetococcales bacterium]|nr:TolC family protein [Magnetococcales bacterium]
MLDATKEDRMRFGLIPLIVSLLCPVDLPATEPLPEPVGASVEELLTLAKQTNPERTAASLEADAAAARAQGAGALPDPMFRWTLDEISKNDNGLPGRVAVEKYTFQQTIPWWGKRELQQGIAAAQSENAKGKLAEVEADIALRIKTAYADYHRAHLSMD